MCSLINYCNRDSFDRFGDDLCELLLQYLPINDCFRLQCVSKQFITVIFNKQTNFFFPDKPMNKCVNIKHLSIDCRYVSDKILDLISVTINHHLKSMEI